VRYRAEGKKQNDQRGSALIVTVLLVTLLVTFVTEFAYEVYIDTTSLSNWSNAQKASLIARSGQTLSTGYLTALNKGHNTESRLEFPVERDFGPGNNLAIRIEDENAKLNINKIYSDGLTNDKALSSLQKLFEYLNINPGLALVIADYIDPDSEPREGHPDSEDNAKNSGLWSVDELKLVNGINKEIFETISPYLTVYGDGKININTATLPVLVSLHADMTETLAKRIIDYRETSPFEDKTHVQKVSGMEIIGQQIQCSLGWCPMIAVKSANFRVTAKAAVNEITRVIESVMDTSMNIQFWREG